MIPWRPIIWGITGPIFTKFSLHGCYLNSITFFSDRSRDATMATNFRGKIGEISPFVWIRRPGISKRIGTYQFQLQKIQWQWYAYIVRKFNEIRSSKGLTEYVHPVAALHQVLAGPMPCHWTNRTWRWDLPVIVRWVRLPSEFRAYFCLFGFSVFPFFLYYLKRVWMLECYLECNTEIPYLDELQVKLVFKLHFST